jgi:hypothetical protein
MLKSGIKLLNCLNLNENEKKTPRKQKRKDRNKSMLFSLVPFFDMSDEISVFQFDFQRASDDPE